LSEKLEPGDIELANKSGNLLILETRAMQLVAVHEKSEGVIVLLLHPGAVLTERQADLTFPGMIEMPLSVSGMIEQIEQATIEDTGRFIQYDGTTAPW